MEGRALDLVVPRQAMDRWCWAAIAASFGKYYGLWPREQVAVVSDWLGEDCAGFRTDQTLAARCNVLAMLDAVLARLGCFTHWSPGRPSWARLAEEIGAGRPVAIGLDWRAGGSHYVAITGCWLSAAAGPGVRVDQIYVDDPMVGPSVQPFGSFPQDYRAGGYWRGTYWTSAPALEGSRDERSVQDGGAAVCRGTTVTAGTG